MSDFPFGNLYHRFLPRQMISSLDPTLTATGDSMTCGRQTGASAAWLGANVAVFIPFTIEVAVTIYRMGWYNGTTVGTNNLDAGIFDRSCSTLLVSTGSTLSAGASAPQQVDVTDTLLMPGDYHLALSCNGTTATVFRAALAIQNLISLRCRTATQFPLANSPTTSFAFSTAFIPLVWASMRSATL